MGMFSEIHAQNEADELEKILLAAIEENKSDVIAFCKQHILPLYTSAISETFSPTVSDGYNKIISVFNGS